PGHVADQDASAFLVARIVGERRYADRPGKHFRDRCCRVGDRHSRLLADDDLVAARRRRCRDPSLAVKQLDRHAPSRGPDPGPCAIHPLTADPAKCIPPARGSIGMPRQAATPQPIPLLFDRYLTLHSTQHLRTSDAFVRSAPAGIVGAVATEFDCGTFMFNELLTV